MLIDNGMRGVTFVLAGDDRRHRRYARNLANETYAEGVEALFRLVGHCPDMPAAYAASDFVVVPARRAADLRPRPSPRRRRWRGR